MLTVSAAVTEATDWTNNKEKGVNTKTQHCPPLFWLMGTLQSDKVMQDIIDYPNHSPLGLAPPLTTSVDLNYLPNTPNTTI